MWRNWYTRTLEVRVALPCEFESRHPHFLVNSQKSKVNSQRSKNLRLLTFNDRIRENVTFINFAESLGAGFFGSELSQKNFEFRTEALVFYAFIEIGELL
jgi:hypothetical protein